MLTSDTAQARCRTPQAELRPQTSGCCCVSALHLLTWPTANVEPTGRSQPATPSASAEPRATRRARPGGSQLLCGLAAGGQCGAVHGSLADPDGRSGCVQVRTPPFPADFALLGFPSRYRFLFLARWLLTGAASCPVLVLGLTLIVLACPPPGLGRPWGEYSGLSVPRGGTRGGGAAPWAGLGVSTVASVSREEGLGGGGCARVGAGMAGEPAGPGPPLQCPRSPRSQSRLLGAPCPPHLVSVDSGPSPEPHFTDCN